MRPSYLLRPFSAKFFSERPFSEKFFYPQIKCGLKMSSFDLNRTITENVEHIIFAIANVKYLCEYVLNRRNKQKFRLQQQQ